MFKNIDAAVEKAKEEIKKEQDNIFSEGTYPGFIVGGEPALLLKLEKNNRTFSKIVGLGEEPEQGSNVIGKSEGYSFTVKLKKTSESEVATKQYFRHYKKEFNGTVYEEYIDLLKKLIVISGSSDPEVWVKTKLNIKVNSAGYICGISKFEEPKPNSPKKAVVKRKINN